jgi:hypothetical protein
MHVQTDNSASNGQALKNHAGGDRQRAIAAFAQALEASSQWYERAANNLALVEGRE